MAGGRKARTGEEMMRSLAVAVFLAGEGLLRGSELPDITKVPEDLKVHGVSEAAPAAGLCGSAAGAGWRVRA